MNKLFSMLEDTDENGHTLLDGICIHNNLQMAT